MKGLSFGLTTFLESGINEETGIISHQDRINHAVEEIIKADEVLLDYYGIGEHHRVDYAASTPVTILSAASKLTKHIHLGSAVTVLSSDDPIRVYQQFATLDLLTNGRAEVMAGRGSFIESFPLFGYDLDDYDDLFTEKLGMLLEIRKQTKVFWQGGKYTHLLQGEAVYPRAKQDPLKVSIAIGGTYQSVVRAAKLGLPVVFAIIGGDSIRFKPLVDLYKQIYKESGHDESKMEIGVHSHGFIGDDDKDIRERYWPSHYAMFSKIGAERGWRNYSKQDYYNSIQQGPLYIGNPTWVANKIIKTIKELGINRFLLHMPGAIMPHEEVLKSIELFGKTVVPMVKKELVKSY